MLKLDPSKKGEPTIFIYESLDELRERTGLRHAHGHFDPSTKEIHATPTSVAHEIAHFKDFQSGKMPIPQQLTNPEDRKRARIRNEVVAILYAWQKHGDPHYLLSHEREFIEWLEFASHKNWIRLEGSFKDIRFSEIQTLGTQISELPAEAISKIEQIFEHYLKMDDELGALL